MVKLYLPLGQSSHVIFSSAHFPAKQNSQVSLPASLIFPTGQSKQLSLLGEP